VISGKTVAGQDGGGQADLIHKIGNTNDIFFKHGTDHSNLPIWMLLGDPFEIVAHPYGYIVLVCEMESCIYEKELNQIIVEIVCICIAEKQHRRIVKFLVQVVELNFAVGVKFFTDGFIVIVNNFPPDLFGAGLMHPSFRIGFDKDDQVEATQMEVCRAGIGDCDVGGWFFNEFSQWMPSKFFKIRGVSHCAVGFC